MKHFITAFLFILCVQAEEFISWQPWIAKNISTGHHSHNPKKALQFQLNHSNHNAETELYYLLPTLEKRKLILEDDVVSLPRTGMDNYHALVVNQRYENVTHSAIRYVYQNGRPSKVSPTKITDVEKSVLEIHPDPLPREHDRYTGSNVYYFELHFKNKALPNHPIILTTSNGSQETVHSNKNGKFSIGIPNDFKEVKTGRRANQPADFILKTSYRDGSITYTTTFSMPYHVNPTDYWQTQKPAVALVLLAFILGVYMFRNVHKKKKGNA